MGVAHALNNMALQTIVPQTIAHGVGSYGDKITA